MLRTYDSCEPVLAYIRNDWACDIAGRPMSRRRTACETVERNNDGGSFVKNASSGGRWCEINPATERRQLVSGRFREDVYIQSSAVFESEKLPVKITIVFCPE